MQGAVGGLLVGGGGVILSGPAHAPGANPDLDSSGGDNDNEDERVNAV